MIMLLEPLECLPPVKNSDVTDRVFILECCCFNKSGPNDACTQHTDNSTHEIDTYIYITCLDIYNQELIKRSENQS